MKIIKDGYKLLKKAADKQEENIVKEIINTKRYGKYKRKNNKVALIISSWNRNNASVTDKSFDIWTINGGFKVIDRIDLLFDMHNWQTSEYKCEYYNKLCEVKYSFPIVVPEFDTNILSKQIPYPKDEVIEMAGMNFRNSLPIAIMYAMIQGYDDMYIFGISSGEYTSYPDMGFSFYYVLGFVRAKGMKVHICNDYQLEDNYFYGYQKMKYEDIRE